MYLTYEDEVKTDIGYDRQETVDGCSQTDIVYQRHTTIIYCVKLIEKKNRESGR